VENREANITQLFFMSRKSCLLQEIELELYTRQVTLTDGSDGPTKSLVRL